MAPPGSAHFAALRAKKRKAAAGAQSKVSTTGHPTVSESGVSRPATRRRKERRLGALDWHNIALPSEIGFDDAGGLLELDEVEGVNVVYGTDGRVSFQVQDDGSDDESQLEADEPEPRAKKRKVQQQLSPKLSPEQEGNDDADAFVSAFPEEDEGEEDDDENEPQDQGAAKEEGLSDQLPVAEPVMPGKLKKKKEKKRSVTTLSESAADGDRAQQTVSFDVSTALPQWAHLPLAEPLYRALAELNFSKPTEIQERALSMEIGALPLSNATARSHSEEGEVDATDEEWGGIQDEDEMTGDSEETDATAEPYISPFDTEPEAGPVTTDRDIVGVAQTGSGKTLAYGLPILSHILNNPPDSSIQDATRLSALILAPTRELALQVRAAISDVSIRTNALLPEDKQDPNKNAPRKRVRGQHISVVALTGGMSVEKQKRQLSRGADVLVATPGRLWDLIGENDELARAIKGVKFLVIDEADRMIENGHFAELENIVKLTRRKGDDAPEDGYVDDFKTALNSHSHVNRIPPRDDMRTFVFSATMSKDLQQNLKKRRRNFRFGRVQDDMSSLDDLLLKLDFRDPDPEIIDLSPEGGLVKTLKECKVECLMPEKDVHLYHFLLRYPGRTIVFLSSIDGIRRLHPLLTLLGLNVVQLHSGMQQRARLKALDRFKSSDKAIMLATDVAARGLDIPSVSHVVHFNLPRTADVYVHRSGRTARAGQEGLALQLISPEDKQAQRLLMVSLGKDDDLVELPVDFSVLDELKKRIELAKKVESSQHKATKEAHDDNWVRQAAEAMEIDLDSDFVFSDEEESSKNRRHKTAGGGGGGDKGGSKRKLKGQQAKAKALETELANLLKKPIMMRGISSKYLTTRNRVDLVDQLVNGTGHASIMGVQQSTALADLPKPKQKNKSQSKR